MPMRCALVLLLAATAVAAAVPASPLLLAERTAAAAVVSSSSSSSSSRFCGNLNHTLSRTNCTLVSCDVNSPAGVLIKCDVKLLGEHIAVVVDLDVCAAPPAANLTIADPKRHFVWWKVVSAKGEFGVPGLSFDLFHIDVGVVVAYEIDTDQDQLNVTLGLQFCGSIGPEKKCYPKTPVDVFKISESIEGLCETLPVRRVLAARRRMPARSGLTNASREKHQQKLR